MYFFYKVFRFYFRILELLLKFAVSFDDLLGIFAHIRKLLFFEIYILPTISECRLLTPFVKFMDRSKDLVSLKMLRLTLPSVTF